MGTAGLWLAVCLLATAAPASAQVTRVSVAADGTQANGESGPAAAMSANGRYIAFTSAASNLVPNDTNGSYDVFLKDRETGEIRRVSVDDSGAEHTGDSGVLGVDISDDGNVIAFTSRAALLSGDTNTCPQENLPNGNQANGPSCTDIYVWSRTPGPNGTLSRPIVTTGGEPNGPSREPKLGTGAFLAFTSDASNLVAGDANGVSDVFLIALTDTPTIRRVSVSSAGVEGNARSYGPAMHDGAEGVAFVSVATNLTDVPDPTLCVQGPNTFPCGRAFFHDVAGTTTRLPTPTATQIPTIPTERGVVSVDVSEGSRYVVSAFVFRTGNLPSQHGTGTLVALFDRVTGAVETVNVGPSTTLAISADSRFVANGSETATPAVFLDRLTGLPDDKTASGFMAVRGLSRNGHEVVFVSGSADKVDDDTNGAADVFVLNRDTDHDGMPDYWENWFFFSSTGADWPDDTDSDGIDNLHEYQRNSHPNGKFRYYFAEGARNAFFTTEFSFANPEMASARMLLRYLSGDGVPATVPGEAVHVELLHRASGGHGLFMPQTFSTTVESDEPIIADRLMRWGTGLAAGSTLEGAMGAPSQTWYFAEGATHGGFDLFYLLQNGTDDAAEVSIEYLRPAPLPPVVKTYVVGPQSRRTVWVDVEGPELEATDVSARITSTMPITAERAMYFSRPGQAFVAGHDGAGVPAPAARWFLAEGATGSFFDLFVLIANPGDTEARLDVTYLLPDGAPLIKPYVVAPRSRLTISVDGEDERLIDTPVSVIVESTNGQPVIVERAMWWPSPDWYEGHLSAATTMTGLRWVIADGFTGAEDGGRVTDYYVLIANTSTIAGSATVTLLRDVSDTSSEPQERFVMLPPNSRVNVPIADLFGLDPAIPHVFGVVVESGGVDIVVERARYTSMDGVTWSQGAAALAARLQ